MLFNLMLSMANLAYYYTVRKLKHKRLQQNFLDFSTQPKPYTIFELCLNSSLQRALAKKLVH